MTDAWLGWSFADGWRVPGRPVIAVDPGLRTGIGYSTPEGEVYGYEGDWYPALEFVSNLIWRLQDHSPLLVCEAFNITSETAKKSFAPWSLEGIGACRYLAQRYGIAFELQQPVEAKKFVTAPRLKEAGWYKSTPGGHVNDGLRHLYLAMAKLGRATPSLGVV